jgi:hypothetical protein
MEALINFLLENIFIVIIVLGILSSLFGRSGKKGGGGRMPDFGGGPGGWPAPGRGAPGRTDRPGDVPARRSEPQPRQTEAQRRPETPWRPDPAPPREWKPGRNLDEHGQVVIADVRPGRAGEPRPAAPHSSRSEAPAAPHRKASPSAAERTAARAAEASRIAPALQVEQRAGRVIAGADDLRKAVLWAEILGPPRALKPYGRRRAGR